MSSTRSIVQPSSRLNHPEQSHHDPTSVFHNKIVGLEIDVNGLRDEIVLLQKLQQELKQDITVAAGISSTDLSDLRKNEELFRLELKQMMREHKDEIQKWCADHVTAAWNAVRTEVREHNIATANFLEEEGVRKKDISDVQERLTALAAGQASTWQTFKKQALLEKEEMVDMMHEQSNQLSMLASEFAASNSRWEATLLSLTDNFQEIISDQQRVIAEQSERIVALEKETNRLSIRATTKPYYADDDSEIERNTISDTGSMDEYQHNEPQLFKEDLTKETLNPEERFQRLSAAMEAMKLGASKTDQHAKSGNGGLHIALEVADQILVECTQLFKQSEEKHAALELQVHEHDTLIFQIRQKTSKVEGAVDRIGVELVNGKRERSQLMSYVEKFKIQPQQIEDKLQSAIKEQQHEIRCVGQAVERLQRETETALQAMSSMQSKSTKNMDAKLSELQRQLGRNTEETTVKRTLNF